MLDLLSFIRVNTTSITVFGIVHDLMSLCSTFASASLRNIKVFWNPFNYEELCIGGQQVTVNRLHDIIQSLMNIGKEILDTHLLLGMSFEKVVARLQLNSITDDVRSDCVNDSFLQSCAVYKHASMLTRQMSSMTSIKQKFVHVVDGEPQFIRSTVRQYLDQAQQFLEIMFVLIHITSGQPARVTELVHMRVFNSLSSYRSVYLYFGSVMFLTAYSKTDSMTQRNRMIARFLPKSLKQLFLVYLMIVRPFER